MKGKFDDLESRKPMSRTISMGPDTGDVKKLKKEFDSFDKKIGNEFNPVCILDGWNKRYENDEIPSQNSLTKYHSLPSKIQDINNLSKLF